MSKVFAEIPPQPPVHDEARRQLEVCNSCRYCEGICAVFPALTKKTSLTSGAITQLAHVCHNCRGCYYACPYTDPHAYAINLPAALAEVREDSYQRYMIPRGLATLFHRHGSALVIVLMGFLAMIFAALRVLPLGSQEASGFYAQMAHKVMVMVFLPAFFLPLFCVALSLRCYWRDIGGGALRFSQTMRALSAAARLKNLSGSHGAGGHGAGSYGEGCNFESGDRFSPARRWAHHLVFYGFGLCACATVVAAIMHYALGRPAPYPLMSPPKLLGLSGGVGMVVGTLWFAALKCKADRRLSAARAWSGEMGFILLLFEVSASGLLLYAAGGTRFADFYLALHLAGVLTFFLLTPYTKMTHGFFRCAALLKDAHDQ